MSKNISKTLFIFFFLVFLSGCGRQEDGISVEDAMAEIENEVEAPASAEITEETDARYPLIATPSSAQWIDLVLVSEGVYCIFDGEKYGFMTEDGEEITPYIYDTAEPFNEGLACVSKEGKYGYIDLEGEIALPFNYDRATSFVEGLAYFVIGDRYGFMDRTGKPVFYLECDSVSSFQNGRAYFSKDGRYGYIDQTGQIVIEPVYDDAGYFSEGLAKVMKDGRTGVINRDGDIVVPTEYDSVTIEGSFIIAKSNGKYVCVDKTGKTLLERSEYIAAIGNYVCFQKEGKQGLSDEKGDILIEPIYQSIYYDSYKNDADGGVLVLRDADGKEESLDASDFSKKISCNYDSIEWIDKERAVVSLGGLYGIIDGQGNIIEQVEYENIQSFDSGAVCMQKDSKTWISDGRGQTIEVVGDVEEISQTGDFYLIEKNGKYGFLNGKGEEAVAAVYSSVLNYAVYGCPDVYILTDLNSDICNSVIKTGESEQACIFEALLHNEITPRIGPYHEFTRNGSISVEDSTVDGDTVDQEDLRDFKKTYKLYDVEHTGEPILYIEEEPYIRSSFPMSYSGFYAIENDRIVEMVTGYECGGSMRGDYACLWYDRETSRVFPGTNGFWGGFGGYASAGIVYEREGAGFKMADCFEWTMQPISYFSNEDLACAELVYDADEQPYTKEQIAQADQEIAQIYRVNQEQVTLEEYQAMQDRYQMLSL